MRIPTIVQRLHCSCSQRLKVANCMKTLGLHTCQHKPPWTNFREIHTKTTPLHVQKNRRFRCKRMRCDLNSMSTLRTSCPCRRMQQCYTMRTMHLRTLKLPQHSTLTHRRQKRRTCTALVIPSSVAALTRFGTCWGSRGGGFASKPL